MGGVKKEEKIKIQTSNRRRQNIKETAFHDRHTKIKKLLKKAEKEALNSDDLWSIVKCERNFVGIYACDELKSLHLLNQPAFLVVNLDYSFQSGSHWIVIHLTHTTVEICDSLGFNVRNWSTYPAPLIKFLNRYISTHKFLVSPALQPSNTLTCGLFCIYFVIFRNRVTFDNCFTKFSSNFYHNNRRLYSALNKIN